MLTSLQFSDDFNNFSTDESDFNTKDLSSNEKDENQKSNVQVSNAENDNIFIKEG